MASVVALVANPMIAMTMRVAGISRVQRYSEQIQTEFGFLYTFATSFLFLRSTEGIAKKEKFPLFLIV
jgi:hypothetical protein